MRYLLIACLALLASAAALARVPSGVPIDVEIPVAPMPVAADGKQQLLYEIHLTNFRAREVELERVEVRDAKTDRLLAGYEGDELASRLQRPGAPPELANKRVIGGGLRAVVFLQLAIDNARQVPAMLNHRFTIKSATGVEVLDDIHVAPLPGSPRVLAPPLRGDGWLALSALSNTNLHRRSLIVVDGHARIAQRFATDWTRIGTDGQAFRGDPANNANWSAYGAQVLAVGDGIVVDLKDGIPENDPSSDKKAVPITLETVGGNYVILALDGHVFAFYAHLQPSSLRVRFGDRVRRGQVLALLGNSGQSDAPHLHFHLVDAPSPLAAEGLPYVFESFELRGVLPSKKLLVNGEGWKATAPPQERRMEMPTENAVVRFRD